MTTVDIWTVDLDQSPACVEAHASVLAADELERADRYVLGTDRTRFVLGRGALRVVLGSYLGISAQSVGFEYGPRGKPRLARPEVSFNVAHSRDLALVAVSDGAELGVDLEFNRPLTDAPRLARRLYSPAEQRQLESLSGAEYETTFLRFWTRKEAVLKLTGDGLSQPLSDVDVSSPGDDSSLQVVRDVSGTEVQFTVLDLRPTPGYLGAIARQGGMFTMRWHTYTAAMTGC
jgi:4'-phosphopantetheinyl transferase